MSSNHSSSRVVEDGANTIDTASTSAHHHQQQQQAGHVHLSSDQRQARSEPSVLPMEKDDIRSLPGTKRRPLGGTSRRELVQRIEVMLRQKAELEARFRKLSRDAPQNKKFKENASDDGRQRYTSGTPSAKYDSTHDSNETDFPSPFAPLSAGRSDDGNEYLEQMVKLAGRLQEILREGGVTTVTTKEESMLLNEPIICKMLLRATPHPERAAVYAQMFAKRNLELYKESQSSNNTMHAGPLQSTRDHPKYVDILMKCIREPFIANMGTFNETEFFLWLIMDVDFHYNGMEESHDEEHELDDTYYEFSAEFFERFPFCGTKLLIDNANRFRRERGDDLIVQTEEMVKAEEYIISLQTQARESDDDAMDQNDEDG